MKELPNMFHNLVMSVLSMGGSTVFLKELHQAEKTPSTQVTLIQKSDIHIFIYRFRYPLSGNQGV